METNIVNNIKQTHLSKQNVPYDYIWSPANKIYNKKIDNIYLQKMIFIMNALENGWDVKKRHDKFIFSKKNQNHKEIYQEDFLQKFVESNI